ncbi:MAG: hypothetical protein QXF52_02455 [Thermoproteota archaeon]
MGGYTIDVWIPSRVRGGKRKLVKDEISKIISGFSMELGARSHLETPLQEDYSWVMVKKGLKYVPEIIDSMFFAVGEILQRLNLDWKFGGRKFMRDYEAVKREMKAIYPYAAELMDKVRIKIRGDKTFKEISANPYGLLWPVEVIGLKKVMNEVEVLLKGSLLSKNDPKDKEIVKEFIKMCRSELPKQITDEDIELVNNNLRKFGILFKEIYEVHKRYNVPLFFYKNATGL